LLRSLEKPINFDSVHRALKKSGKGISDLFLFKDPDSSPLIDPDGRSRNNLMAGKFDFYS